MSHSETTCRVEGQTLPGDGLGKEEEFYFFGLKSIVFFFQYFVTHCYSNMFYLNVQKAFIVGDDQ